MTATINELQAIVEKYSLLLARINEADYNKHLLHHLHQMLNMEPVACP
ncbi:hypothetical protein [Agriterribacter sp.]|nr:hypothetical protein [Agriterribacter sp.]HTN06257.1 hypothetical protein [Agriterribacter sp.]